MSFIYSYTDELKDWFFSAAGLVLFYCFASCAFMANLKPTMTGGVRGERENNYVNKAENEALDT